MKDHFNSIVQTESDKKLINETLEGSAKSLEKLLKKHQHYIYNIAFRMVLNPMDAEDITQEVLIKITTKLSQFKQESNFKTWVYRITFNHFLSLKNLKAEKMIVGFDNYGEGLDSVKDIELPAEELIEKKELIEEAKFSCMAGMLLCLSREQRLVYILGELFEVNHSVGAELLEISKDNFRKKLERARRDLYQFMNKKCGLVNKKNPCRCARKTSGFVKNGWVSPQSLQYNANYVEKIRNQLHQKNENLTELLESDYQAIYQDSPFYEKPHAEKLMKTVLSNEKVKDIFNLN